MNVLHLLTEIEKHDPEVYGRLDSRRTAMRQFAGIGKKLAAAAVPVAFGSMFRKAYGQTTLTVLEVLNYALTLEYLEAEFYTTALAKSGLIPAGASVSAIQTISTHETQHVAFLRTAITAAGGMPVAKPTFDFSGGSGSGTGPFKDAFNSYQLFLAVAQTLEDTGVRAYKGQAPNLLGKGDVLTAALNIHSVEARHASHVRQMNRAAGFAPTVKPWITGDDPGLGTNNALVAANYAGEGTVSQATINITNIGGQMISSGAASESFDEPLSRDQVLVIIKPFIKA
ncbi:MAG: ferritin-like domain-containing protein [Cytophagaceae bacterium]|nr:ferritin-like domain-containing protein [Cytophagaceae bacterium]